MSNMWGARQGIRIDASFQRVDHALERKVGFQSRGDDEILRIFQQFMIRNS